MSLDGAWRSLKPYLLMVFLQVGFSGMFIISVASLKRGMNHYVLVVYRNGIAAAVVAPFSLWFEGKSRPKMTLSVFLKIMALALLEPVLDQNFYYMGAKNTSASFFTALDNILPAITFVSAIVLRMEKINMKTRRTQAKVAGTLVTVIGAVLMILFKGPAIEFIWNKGRSQRSIDGGENESHWLVGTFMIVFSNFSCFRWSAFLILQSYTLKAYPAELSLSTLICLFGAGQSAVVALAMERSTKPWLIGFDTRLLTAAYSGIMYSGVTYYVQGIVMKERGPVFVTAFSPLCMIITTLMGSIIPAEEITLGRLVGALIIVIGLYFLLWGKSKDHSVDDEKEAAIGLPKVANDAMKSHSMDNVPVVHVQPAKN